MKKLILLIYIISFQILLSQSYEPIQKKLVYPKLTDTSSQEIYLDEHPDFNVNDKFFLGWHWESGGALTKSFKMNQIMPNIYNIINPSN